MFLFQIDHIYMYMCIYIHTLKNISSLFSVLLSAYQHITIFGFIFLFLFNLFLLFRPISSLLLRISSHLLLFFLFHSQLVVHFFSIFLTSINTNIGKTVSSDLLRHLTNLLGICHAVSIFDIYLQIFHEWS